MPGKRTVLITGGTSGIGLELTKRCHADGDNLILVSLTPSKLVALKEELTALHAESQITTLALDLGQPGAANQVFEECERQGLQVDVLINNAGFGLLGENNTLDPARMTQMLELNVVALTLLCRLFGEKMCARGHGAILNVASTAAYQPLPTLAAYAASKAYVRAYSEALSQEYAAHGVYVSCLCPGPTMTNFFDTAGASTGKVNTMATSVGMTAADVAAIGMYALAKRRRTIIPGLINRMTANVVQYIPNRIVVETAYRILKS